MTETKKIMERHKICAKRSLGQNFLVNPETAKKIARLSLAGLSGGDCAALEIGPGLGALTVELCEIYKKVVAVELDRAFEPRLGALGRDNLKAVYADFLELDVEAMLAQELPDIKNINICANLPYYITTPVILKIIRGAFAAVTVMVQKEAADKLCANAGSANYCETSALVSYFGGARKLFNVPRSDFYPQPSILSTVVQIIPRRTCEPKDEQLFFAVIRAAFGQRRKTLANALASQVALDKQELAAIAEKITGDANIRGEQLNITEFAGISDLIREGLSL